MPTSDQVHLPPLIARLIGDFESVGILWQLAVLAPALLAGWIIARHFHKLAWHADTKRLDPALRITLGGLDRIVLPLVALALVFALRWIIRRSGQSTHLLDLAVPLLFSFVIVHSAVYLLRHAFHPSGAVRYWERIIGWTIWLGLALHITGLLADLRSLLEGMQLSVGKQSVSLYEVVSGALSVALTVLIALWIGRLIEGRLQGATALEPSLRAVFSKLARTLLVALAVLIALPLVGIDLTVLSVFGGALGVGLGFGLQKIAANYVSGFIILLDRSITPGALLTVEGRYGQVTRLNARYVVLRGMDGTEAIIPNETLVNSTVVNHSYTDNVVRIDMRVQISYASDVERALQLLLDVATRHERVLADPPPASMINDFADNGINLDLYVWVEDPENGRANLRSEIYLEIWKTFQADRIEIPFPQREVRIVKA
jgi:small-conductance mechanosensitive channel